MLINFVGGKGQSSYNINYAGTGGYGVGIFTYYDAIVTQNIMIGIRGGSGMATVFVIDRWASLTVRLGGDSPGNNQELPGVGGLAIGVHIVNETNIVATSNTMSNFIYGIIFCLLKKIAISGFLLIF